MARAVDQQLQLPGQGFFPASAGKFKANSYSAYVDLETEFTDKWSGAVAVRYEKADGFSSAVVYKLSSRYAFTDTFAVPRMWFSYLSRIAGEGWSEGGCTRFYT